MPDVIFKDEDSEIEPEVESIVVRFKGGKEVKFPERLFERQGVKEYLPNPRLFLVVVGHDGLKYMVNWKGAISPYVLQGMIETFKGFKGKLVDAYASEGIPTTTFPNMEAFQDDLKKNDVGSGELDT